MDGSRIAFDPVGKRFLRVSGESGYTSFAELNNPIYAAGVALCNALSFLDTAPNLLAAATSPKMTSAFSVLLSTSASLTVANIATLAVLPNFSMNTGQFITAADTGANLLTVTTNQKNRGVSAFKVAITSTVTVTVTEAQSLVALPQFAVLTGIALTVAGPVSQMTTSPVAAGLPALAAVSGIVISVSDTLANLLANISAITTLKTSVTALIATMTDSQTVAVSDLSAIMAIPAFRVLAGQTLTVSDTVANLAAITTQQAAIMQATGLSQADTATVQQLTKLLVLPGFTKSVDRPLTVVDTLANVGAVTSQGRAAVGAMVVADTMAHLLAATSLPTGVTGVRVLLDGNAYTVAQGAALLTLLGQGKTLSLVGSGNATDLKIQDTLVHLTSAQSTLSALAAAGSVSILPTDANGTFTAAVAASLSNVPGFDPADYTLSVADTGAALSAVAVDIFGHGFATITVTTGKFSGMVIQLLDPALRFGPTQSGSNAPPAATAELSVNATVDAEQSMRLAHLPGFSIGAGVTLTLSDTMANLIAAARVGGIAATDIVVTDAQPLSAADAAVLANMREVIGTSHFDMGSNVLVIDDLASEIADPAHAAGIAMATTVRLSDDSIINAAEAMALAALGSKFEVGGFSIVIFDTVANLTSLAQSSSATDAVNGWGSLVLLSNGATLSLAATQVLAALEGVANASRHITISDTAANLVAGEASPILHSGIQIRLSADAVVSVADMAKLATMPTLALNGRALVVQDTPEHLATLAPFASQLATSVQIVTKTFGNATQFTIDAAELRSLANLPHLSTANLTDLVVVSDSAQALVGIASFFSGSSNNPLRGHVTLSLSADAVLNVSGASALAATNSVSLDGHSLQVLDVPTALLSSGAAQALALATQVGLSVSVVLPVDDATALVGVTNYTDGSNALFIADTPARLLTLTQDVIGHSSGQWVRPQTSSNVADYRLDAADVMALAELPALSFPDFSGIITVEDTAANLVTLAGAFGSAASGSELLMIRAASMMQLSDDATISMAQARTLGELGLRFVNNGHTLIVEDEPSQLQSPSGWSGIAGQITGFHLAAADEPWVVTAAVAAKLSALVGFDDGPGMAVVDTVGNLLAPANANGLTAAVSVAPSGDITVTVAQAAGLQQIQDFSLGGHTMTISDGGGRLASLDSATIALASSIKLGGSSLVTVAQFDILRELPNFSTDGRLLVISDTATNLLTLTADDVAMATMIVVSGNASLTAAEADALAELPRFSTGIARLTVLDTAANLLHISGNGELPDNWEGAMLASHVLLTANATITAEQAADLAVLGSRFSRDGHNLTISDSPQALLDPANAAGLSVATAIALSTSTVTISALQAARLEAIGTFDKGETVVTVSDTAANLMSAGYAGGIAMADHAQLSAAVSLSVQDAIALIGMPNFAVNANAALTIRDSLDDLLRLGEITLSDNDSILDATRIMLAADVQATAAELVALAALPQYGLTGATFSRDGHALVLADTGSDIAAFTPDSIAAPTAYRMIGDDTLSAAEADILAARSTDLDGNRLILADNPTALLDSLHASGRALATAITLAGDTVTTASTATALFATQKFTTGGHDLVVQDSAQALLGLSADVKIDVTMLALGASQSVSVATLHSLAGLGILFDLNGHALTVVDTAANLATLSEQELALVSVQLLSENAVVNAATLEGMAALPDFALPDGVTLTVRDSVANLLALSNGAVAISTSQQLPSSSSVVVTAAEAAALANLPDFSAPGSTVVVRDTIAHLNASENADWPDVATRYEVFDSIGNIIAHASSDLLTGAHVVTPSGDSSIDAATAGVLAGLPEFDRAELSVSVVDSVAEIAAHAGDILAVATGARVNLAPPATAAQAQALASLDDAGLLSFNSGLTLTVIDTFAHLSDAANADGRVLAAAVTIQDTVANLLLAAAFDWGTVEPIYKLTANGSITGAHAAVLAALGNDLNLNGQTLTVVDNAAGAAGHVAAILALNVLVEVTDTAANVGAATANLQDILDESQITSISLTNAANLTPAAAALLFPLRSVLAGDPVTVVGNAATVMANFNNLDGWTSTLASVHVTDTAVNLAAAAATNPGLQDIDTQLIVTVSGATTVTAAVAAGISPLGYALESGTSLDVTDTVAAISGNGSAIASLGSAIGTVTVTDSLTITADRVSGLSAVRTHFGDGVQFAIVDTAAHVSTAITPIGAMLSADRISAVTVDDETVASVLTHATNLTTAAADVSILDTAANVRAQMFGLSSFMSGGGALTGITLSDSGTPTIELAISQFAGNEAVMEAVDSPFDLVISDFAGGIQADLVGGNSRILAHLDIIDVVQVADDETITLTVAQITATGVNDGAGSALSKLNLGDTLVTGATVANLDTLVGLGVAPDAIEVSDTAAHIQADLASGGSDLLANRALITTIDVSDAGTITLTSARVREAHVNDGDGSVMSKVDGASLIVTGVSVADIPTIFNLPRGPVSITVGDTAANLATDLALGASSEILGRLDDITAIANANAGAITLTASQVLFAGVNDGAGSALSKVTGGSLIVTSVTVAQIDAIIALGVAPASIAISDTAANIEADLISGSSDILANLADITAITVSDAGLISLTKAQVELAGVNDGTGSAMDLMTGGTLRVTGLTVAEIDAAMALDVVPDSLTVSDTAAHIASDIIAGGSSDLLGNRTIIFAIANSDAGALSLTEAQVTAANVNDGAGSILSKVTGGTLVVTDALAASVGTLADLPVAPSAIPSFFLL